MKLYAIYGASGFGFEVMPLARQQLQIMQLDSYELVFVDDNPFCDSINGHAVMTYQDFLSKKADQKFMNIAIADSTIRETLVKKCQSDHMDFFTIKSSLAVEMDDCKIGEGAILCPFVTLTSNLKIGKHFHANLYSYVAHNCVIGDYVTFAPGVKCNGNILIEDHVYVGTGAILRNGKPGAPLVIGRGAIVGMGAVVTKSVFPGETVIGNPARKIEKR